MKKWPWILGLGAAGAGVYLLTRKKSIVAPVEPEMVSPEEYEDYTEDPEGTSSDTPPATTTQSVQAATFLGLAQITPSTLATLSLPEGNPPLVVKLEPGVTRLRWHTSNSPLPSTEQQSRRWATYKEGGQFLRRAFSTFNKWPPFQVEGCPSNLSSADVEFESLKKGTIWVRLMMLPGFSSFPSSWTDGPSGLKGPMNIPGVWVGPPIPAKIGDTIDFGPLPLGLYILDTNTTRLFCPSPGYTLSSGDTHQETIKKQWGRPLSEETMCLAGYQCAKTDGFKVKGFRLMWGTYLTLGDAPAGYPHIGIEHKGWGPPVRIRPLLSIWMSQERTYDPPAGLKTLLAIGEWLYEKWGLTWAINKGKNWLGQKGKMPKWKIADMMNWPEFKRFKTANKPPLL